MKKSIFIAALIVAAGLFLARPSRAQLHAGGVLPVVNGDLPSPPNPPNSPNIEGTFNVLATQASTDVWDITVSWLSNVNVPNDYIDDIQIKFSGGGVVSNGTIAGNEDLVTILGGTGSVGATNYSPFLHPGDTEIEGQDPNTNGPPPTGAVDNGNSYSGTVTLAPGSNPITGVEFTISNDGGGTLWFATTPEGSSLALLLPGLIPLGLILRRRRRA